MVIAAADPGTVDGVESFEVQTVTSVPALLDTVGDSHVVVLDRDLPTGDVTAVLDKVQTTAPEARVVVLDTEDPGFDAIAQGFDGALTKPVAADDLEGVVRSLLDRIAFVAALESYYELMARRAELETVHDEATLADHEEYRSVCADIEAERELLDGLDGELESEVEFVGTVREIVREDRPREFLGDTDE